MCRLSGRAWPSCRAPTHPMSLPPSSDMRDMSLTLAKRLMMITAHCTSAAQFLFCWCIPALWRRWRPLMPSHPMCSVTRVIVSTLWKPFISVSDVLSGAWVQPGHSYSHSERQRVTTGPAANISLCTVTTCNFQTYLPQLLHAKFAKNHEKYIFTNLTNILRISFKLSLHNFPLSGCWVQNLAIYAATSDPCRTQPSSSHIKDNNNPMFSVTYHNIGPVCPRVTSHKVWMLPGLSMLQFAHFSNIPQTFCHSTITSVFVIESNYHKNWREKKFGQTRSNTLFVLNNKTRIKTFYRRLEQTVRLTIYPLISTDSIPPLAFLKPEYFIMTTTILPVITVNNCFYYFSIFRSPETTWGLWWILVRW